MLCDFEEDAADHMRDRTRAPEWWPPDQRSCEDDDGDAVAPMVTSVFTQDVPINLFLPDGTLFIGNALILLIGTAVRILSLYGGLVLWRSRGRMERTHVLIWTAVIIFAPFIGSIVWIFFGRELHGVNTQQDLSRSMR